MGFLNDRRIRDAAASPPPQHDGGAEALATESAKWLKAPSDKG
jgi:hypothetical protein